MTGLKYFSINILEYVEICFLPLLLLYVEFENFFIMVSQLPLCYKRLFMLQILVSCFVKTSRSEEYLRVKVRLDCL